MEPILYIIVPCYNEEDMLPKSFYILLDKLMILKNKKEIDEKSKILFVNDGSKDKTWELIKKYNRNFSCHIKGICLSKNEGHQTAVTAGIEYAKNADIIISIDCDLQDDINSIDTMIDKYKNGMDIVYGVRSKRNTDSFLKRFTAESYYKILKFLGVNIIYNHADYRLMDKRAIQGFLQYRESNLFLRGIVPDLGFKTDYVYYERKERTQGTTKYSISKMLKLAIDGITSFSIKPLTFLINFGLLLIVIGISIGIIGILKNTNIWNTLLLSSLWFLSGCIIFSTGIIGTYIGRIYIESKHRPRYFIMDEV